MNSTNPIVAIAINSVRVARNAITGSTKILPYAQKNVNSKEDKADLAAALKNKTFEEAYAENEAGGIKGIEYLDTFVRDAVYDALALYQGGVVSPKTQVTIGEYKQALELACRNIVNNASKYANLASWVKEARTNAMSGLNGVKKLLGGNLTKEAKAMLKEAESVLTNGIKTLSSI